MRDLATFFLNKSLREVKLIKWFSSKSPLIKFYLWKFMSSFLVLLTNLFVKILCTRCRGEFEMSIMGEINYFLGLQVKQLDHGTFLCQTKYYKKLLKKFKMDKSNEVATPMATNCYLSADEKGKSIDQTRYQAITNSLLYLIASRPGIMFSVCMCSRYQSSLKESYLLTIKMIMKYLKGKH